MKGWRRTTSGLLLAAVLLPAGPAAWAQERVPGTVELLPAKAGTVQLRLSADDLPADVSIDPSSVTVTAGGTRWPATAVASGGATEQRTVVLVVDTSGSMGEAGMAAARAAGERYLASVSEDVSIGLVTFADQARVAVPPTLDRGAVRSALAAMRPDGSTALYDGLLLALRTHAPSGERSVVLLSDGEDTASGATLDAAGAALQSSGVSVDLVSFGTAGGQRAALDALAARAGGRVLQADDSAQLVQAFATAARTLVDEVTVTAQVPDELAGKTTDLAVEVAAGGSTISATTPVSLTALPTDTAGTVAASPSVVTTSVPWLLPVVLVVAFLALFAMFAVAFSPSRGTASASRKRMHDIERYSLHVDATAEPAPAASAALTESALAWAGRTVQRRGVEDSWRMELDRAAIPLKPHEWMIIRLSVALVGAALAVVFLPWWLLTAPVCALGAWVLAGTYVRVKAARRLKKFAENLPDVLQLIAGSLRTGFSLPQAVDNAAKDGEQPMAGELSRALAESRLGVDLEDALERVAERMKNTDLTWTVMAVRIAREVGGNLAEVLLGTAETMRERSRIQRQVRALSAEGRLSAYILLGLPIGITIFMVLFRRSYIAPLVTDPLGWLMTGYGFVSVAIGAFVMSRMCKLEV